MLSEESLSIIVEVLRQELSPDFIILFGSFSDDTARPDSDVDIAFLGSIKRSRYELFMIAQRLATQLDKDVDLIDLDTASTVLRQQVAHKGALIFSENEQKYVEFRMRAYKEYARLNEERADVLRRFAQGGEE
ncbi:MAG: nucleotidyltransferase domain-containing protein [Bacillota bacterium]|nr:nucleotidyltransferase domain-containing protein [Bacillota bacterium]